MKRHDIAAMAEKRRRNLVQTKDGTEVCRCCCDPNSDGGEYQALIEYKMKHSFVDSSNNLPYEEEKKEPNVDDDDDDSDDEFDYLLDEDLPQDDKLNELEEKRRGELEFQALANQTALQHGYGTHRQLHPVRVLKAAGLGDKKTRQPPPAVVLHLVDPDSLASASLDYFLETKLAAENKGTIFLRSAGRSTLLMDSALSQKAFPHLKPDRDMPALVAIRDGVVVNTCPNLRQFCVDKDCEVETHAVESFLDRCGVLLTQAPNYFDLCFIRPEEDALMDYLAQPQQQKAEPEVERYDCGVEGCCKTFFHEHVGIKTSEQDGLVVKEDVVLGNEESSD